MFAMNNLPNKDLFITKSGKFTSSMRFLISHVQGFISSEHIDETCFDVVSSTVFDETRLNIRTHFDTDQNLNIPLVYIEFALRSPDRYDEIATLTISSLADHEKNISARFVLTNYWLFLCSRHPDFEKVNFIQAEETLKRALLPIEHLSSTK
ncbi:hypothetical protein [Vibrio barjaei]|uniref:hypothetical protein n=1 Tax=Vibrio barjaei TaxID=1676683 RepID=UPI0022833046|nr:hypothetical protein [Vibrio barjaei]MCY9874584.1 hypothetical protein [Vibrio barjaei]